MTPISLLTSINLATNALNSSTIDCAGLNLTSQACLEDCQIYGNYQLILAALSSKNNTIISNYEYYIDLYSYSSHILGYQDTGNYDMCTVRQ